MGRMPVVTPPDLVSIELFLRAAQVGSLSKAAKELHLSLSAASRRIGLLEERLGVQLLSRTTTGVVLTPAGTALVFHAKQLLSQVDSLKIDLGDYADSSKGVVRLCAATSALSGYLPPDLATFAEKHPGVKSN